MSIRRFEFAWDPRYRVAGLPFGVTPWTARVELSPSQMAVRFGPWSLHSALGNITGAEVTEDYAFLKTAGPPHLSFADRGITFATNGQRGLCLSFDEPVKGIDPTGRILHRGATVTVEDIEGLRQAIGLTPA